MRITIVAEAFLPQMNGVVGSVLHMLDHFEAHVSRISRYSATSRARASSSSATVQDGPRSSGSFLAPPSSASSPATRWRRGGEARWISSAAAGPGGCTGPATSRTCGHRVLSYRAGDGLGPKHDELVELPVRGMDRARTDG